MSTYDAREQFEVVRCQPGGSIGCRQGGVGLRPAMRRVCPATALEFGALHRPIIHGTGSCGCGTIKFVKDDWFSARSR